MAASLALAAADDFVDSKNQSAHALVCVFLGGGNDGNNMIVPTGTTDYNKYAAIRSAAALAIAHDSLLPIATSSGETFGLHPSLTGLHDLWNDQKLAVACNVGPLVQPMTREDYQNGAPRPNQLFSHSDQIAQWHNAMKGASDADAATAELKRAVDLAYFILMFTGVATNVCVETTARQTFLKDYYVVFTSDLDLAPATHPIPALRREQIG
jgi:uncharacterized protein (DUF1501 family)